ncbi:MULTISPECIES: hypothetical protein [Halorussus]|uniref:hypothetical protein n=1 Tax=Halorussus TaxID=1070314 RepID=UPI00209DDFDB|nr:hypothetical protein [Halorussus vallis]USZ76615.1 hypothetical protein NGM07_04630 [Halorussus vallis]
MSLESGRDVRSNFPTSAELAVVTAALVGVSLWRHVVGLVTDPLSAVVESVWTSGGLAVVGLVTGGLFVAGLALFVGAYARFRGLSVGLAAPSRRDVRLLVLAGVAPAAFVGVTAFVGSFTGVPYGSLTKTYYAASEPLAPILTVVGLSLLVGVPSLVLICQVLVQESFAEVVGGRRAAVLTTLATGFVMTSTTGGLATVPDRGKLVGAALFVLALGVALYATRRTDNELLQYLAHAPALLFVALVVSSGVLGTESLAEGLFALSHVAVLGVAADTYDRSDSLVVPALAYASLILTNSAVVLFFETGIQSW